MRSPRRSHRLTPTLEHLEDRLLLSGDLIASQLSEQGGFLTEYTQGGAIVQSQSIGDGRGLTVDPSGNVDLYEGTFAPILATYSPTLKPLSSQTLAGWSTVNNLSYGEVAAYRDAANKDFVFASDMLTYGDGGTNGIVRFSLSGDAPVRFGQGTDYIQVSLGRDGLLYGLSYDGQINVFNPDTLAPVRSFSLVNGPDRDVRSIAVDPSGQIYAATWDGYVAKFDPSGHYTGSSITLPDPYLYPYVGNENLDSIALDKDGQIAVGGRFGEIYLTNESLSSPTTIKTGLGDTFVTFDHYIGTAPQISTPSFSALAGPTITYGQPTTTLGGTISAGSAIPPGSVTITVAGVTKSAAINASDGTFSAVFDTSALIVSGSPYTITYSYAAQGNYAGTTDTSKSLTVVPAVTTLGSLSSPTMVIGTATATLSGAVGSNSVLPVGQTVTVRVAGTNIPVASGTIGSDGSFSVTVNTAALPVGAYTIQYSYGGDANFKPSQGSGTLTVTYAVNPVFNNTKPVHEGAALPIKLQVTDASGNDLSSANLTVTAVSLIGPNGNTITPSAKGNANPGNLFRHTGSGYLYNLDTTGLTAGTYTLMVRVGNDPVLHAISFVVD